MIKQLIDLFCKTASGASYWLSLIVACLCLLSVAVYYQFVLEELPCIMCIQIRLLLVLLIFISVIGLLLRRFNPIKVVPHLLVFLVVIGLVDRSYQLLGTERGFIFSDCGFSLGLPEWLAVESWIPWLFQVETSCGYTPELILGITMAESLMVLSVLLMVFSFFVAIASFFNRHTTDE